MIKLKESQQLKKMLNPQNFAMVITQAVSCLHIKTSRQNKQARIYQQNGIHQQTISGANGSFNSLLFCWYCKYTGYLKDNCIQLNQWLAKESQEANSASTKLASASTPD